MRCENGVTRAAPTSDRPSDRSRDRALEYFALRCLPRHHGAARRRYVAHCHKEWERIMFRRRRADAENPPDSAARPSGAVLLDVHEDPEHGESVETWYALVPCGEEQPKPCWVYLVKGLE